MQVRIGYRGLLGVAAAAAMMAAVVAAKSRQAEKACRPSGQFITVDGVRLHYIDQGSGEPLLLLHGNGTSVRELELSGLVEQLAQQYRVIAFDRPGHGHSEHLENGSDPDAQAAALSKALQQLGIQSATVAGHSWGTLAAIALALSHPQQVRRLVLMSGYYFPLPRLDALLMLPSSLPWLGGVLRHTVSPLLGRLAWPLLLRKLFSPAQVTQRFRTGYPAWLALRPAELRTSTREGVRMPQFAERLSMRFRELTMPVTIIAGTGDLQVSPQHHAKRLHAEIPHSQLVLIPGAGHMVHHTATAQVANAIGLEREAAVTLSPGAFPATATPGHAPSSAAGR